MRVVMVGAGRVAVHLAMALHRAGHEVLAVYSRTEEHAAWLAAQTQAVPVTRVEDLPTEADAYLVAVKDSVLTSLIPLLTEGRQGQTFLHTAGSMPMDVFRGACAHYGVFYPMQTFSRERAVDFSQIPLFLEASDATALGVARTLADSLSRDVRLLSSTERRQLHLAAVFACNFVNHCYALSAEVLAQCHLPFEVMLPLIDETARKVHTLHPLDAQTGPAVRYDENVIRAQADMLAGDPLVRDIYERMSLDIHLKNKKND